MTDTTLWVPVALSTSIEPGTSAGTSIDGAEYVVWRDDKGKAHVWEDRCPHRGMRLSFGFVRGDQIACLYHGWRYDNAGQCRLIPAHPDLDVPKTIKVPTFAVVEAAGLIWAAVSPDTDRTTMPDLPEDLLSVRSLYVDAPLALCRDRLAEVSPPDMEPAEVAELSPLCLQRTAAGSTLVIAFQPLNADRTALHILVSASADNQTRAQLATWATGLRFALENSYIRVA
ncbi:Rieske (2Fe-2S) protein [Rhizobium sp. CECT 9324]|uniref:Rieske (2Fe-2S) protein n=1 Tax=Rhizobium sp. CECT 9324 TaxID=2845820 RepID=UPI001E371F48|nr:Rieske (2Fe-2S) protein [Rhizobium sp. CECT 9324]CAH0341947.1 hypothetical protein RHI9324_03655 [Rhizobium sp. CECT 9324]